MELSPFPFQGPLEPLQVKGREPLIADLTERLTERRVTALLGPRRYGKTSVLVRVADDLAKAGTSVVWIDLYEVTSVADVALRLDAALNGARGPVRARLATIAASVDLNLGLLKLGFARRKDERPDALATLHLLLDTLVSAAHDHPTVVVFDEFPGITRVDGVAGLVRTKLQHHFQEIGIVFAGSQPSLMRTMFTDKTMPFYAQADLVPVGPFTASAVTDIVDGGFQATGRDPGSLSAAIFNYASGHPHRTMQTADAAWRAAEPGAPYTASVWEDALVAVRASTDLANETVYSSFLAGEKMVLRLIAGQHSLFGAGAQLIGLASGTAQHARDSLLGAGDIVKAGSGYALVDPVLSDWIKRRLPV
ncbi:MAG TPA: ATP-binding protein [Ilumatobacteraceae bacterium]